MSNNIGHSSLSFDASQSLKNNSSILRRSMSLPVLLDPPFETNRGCHLKLGGGALEVSKLIRKDLIFMKDAVVKVNKYKEDLNVKINEACEEFRKLQTSGSETELEELRETETKLEELRKTVSKLKCRIPSNLNLRFPDSNRIQNPWSGRSIDYSQADHVNNATEVSTIDFGELFRRADSTEHMLLSCFLKFPRNAIIKKRLIVYWWIGAELITKLKISHQKEEQAANEYFDELVKQGFIEPVYEKRDLVADSCRIHPSLYYILSVHAGRYFSVVNSWVLSQKIFYLSVFPNFGSATLYDGPLLSSTVEQDAKILYLGRWQSSASHHIEVANMKFFDQLKNMKELRFFSLRGISLITELPQYILNHTNLMILDLRACYNLETLPDRIDLLKNLTHLDTSECYFLEQMPKALSTLQKLEVLKGFVIGDSMSNTSCSLGDLAKLQNLIKLNIYYRGVKNFPTNEQLGELQTFCALKKLTIAWGGNSSEIQSLESQKSQEVLSLPLHKLDLQGFPGTNVPNWLRPAKLKNLKKLYIRGGRRLHDLQQFQSNEEIRVEIMRFRYLTELHLDWGNLKILFPRLKHLDIKKCPNLSGFPCDTNNTDGVWLNMEEYY